ncbi:hypothetical protein SUDANB108_03782 [Streptomyces sp. enrichment culture]|uniref:hypothetical protein n=1 Tax=Streptomyces sp. enrichment culture TaxID=1795815 RepID=UPI003F551DB1
MPSHSPNRPVCHHCAGFCVVAITTGARHHDGTRILLRVECRACQGTGHATSAASVRAGR